jgi:hypothetical protein
MTSSMNDIHNAKVRAAEDAAIAAIPPDLMSFMQKTQAEFAAKGGCKGCGSKLLAVHDEAKPPEPACVCGSMHQGGNGASSWTCPKHGKMEAE